jgi:alkylhydroperoxidase/carboxymuconolactone decarboxylase family protein YurZ
LEELLNAHSSETFRDALIAQYRDLIHEAIIESEIDHKTRMDIGKLNSKLKVIFKAAKYDGLSESTISELIDQAMPYSAPMAA